MTKKWLSQKFSNLVQQIYFYIHIVAKNCVQNYQISDVTNALTV